MPCRQKLIITLVVLGAFSWRTLPFPLILHFLAACSRIQQSSLRMSTFLDLSWRIALSARGLRPPAWFLHHFAGWTTSVLLSCSRICRLEPCPGPPSSSPASPAPVRHTSPDSLIPLGRPPSWPPSPALSPTCPCRLGAMATRRALKTPSVVSRTVCRVSGRCICLCNGNFFRAGRGQRTPVLLLYCTVMKAWGFLWLLLQCLFLLQFPPASLLSWNIHIQGCGSPRAWLCIAFGQVKAHAPLVRPVT